MKNKKRKYILLIIIVILFIGVITIYNNYNNDIYVDKDSNLSNSGLSLMVETKAGSGEYTISTSDEWPTKGYEFNAEKSACENGGTLSWDEENQSVVMTSKSSDKCYAYFDIVPPDVTIAVNNLPTTYGKLGSINCINSDAIYNQQYNRVEISRINKKYTSCDLNYTDSTSKVNFADYITGLAGTTQGTGEVVNEVEYTNDWDTAVTLSESSYISREIFTGSNYNSTSGTSATGKFTFSNNTWSSASSSMASSSYYHFKFKFSENGNYQMCYKYTKGSMNNRIYTYVNDVAQSFGNWDYIDASSVADKSGCIELGYITTADYVKIVQKTYSPISTFSFSIKKSIKINTIEAGIRYEGKNPNNYVWFNNEYWRIIGVFDSSTHGQTGKNLVKIIRNDILSKLVWHTSNANNWKVSSLNSLLNGAYYSAQDGTSSGYCYGYTTKATANCDYTKKGIQSGYREMIAKVTWHLGGVSTASITAGKSYNEERGTAVYGGNATTVTGYIGLMYPSDYGYSVLSSSCARTTNLGSYSSSTCAGTSWLYGKGYEWTLAPYSTVSVNVYFLNSGGNLNYNYSYDNGHSIRPVLYLDTSVYKIDGEGTLDKPYIIGM